MTLFYRESPFVFHIRSPVCFRPIPTFALLNQRPFFLHEFPQFLSLRYCLSPLNQSRPLESQAAIFFSPFRFYVSLPEHHRSLSQASPSIKMDVLQLDEITPHRLLRIFSSTVTPVKLPPPPIKGRHYSKGRHGDPFPKKRSRFPPAICGPGSHRFLNRPPP